MNKVIQNSFTGGEQSPAMFGRIDDQGGYQAGLAKCENFIVLPQGPVQNRAGFEFVRAAKYADKKCILIPFTFNTSQTMVIELGEKYARFHTEGATLLGSNGRPYEVATPYLASDLDEIHYVQSADVITLVHPAYAPRELQRYGPADWRLKVIDFGKPIDAPTGLSGTYACSAKTDVVTEAMRSMYTIRYVVTAVKDTGVGTNIDESPQSATASVTGNLFVDASKVTLTWNQVEGAQRYRVYKTYSGRYGFIGEVEGTTFVDTNVGPDESITPPRYIDPFYQKQGITSVTVTNGGSGYGTKRSVLTISPVGKVIGHFVGGGTTTKTVNLNNGAFNHTEDNGLPYPTNGSRTFSFDGVIEGSGSGGKGRLTFTNQKFTSGSWWYPFLTEVTLLSPGSGYTDGARLHVSFSCGSKGAWCEYYFPAVLNSATKPKVIVTDPTGYGAELEAQVNSEGVITGIRIISPGQGYTDPKIIIDGSASGGSGATATASVGQAGDYPGAVTYFQQRRVFAGSYTRPQFVWMTRPGTENDMHNTLPAQDDNCIAVRAAVAETSRIRHLIPLTSLMLLTASSEIRTTTSNDDVITPTSIGFLPQTYYGAAPPQPLLVGRMAVFASERGGHIRSLGYSYQKGGFDSDDLSIRAAHLFENTDTVSLALSKTPYPIIWCVTSEGTLLGCTYLADQNVTGWHKHTTKDGAFEAVTVVAEGNEDILYAVIRRTINGQTVRYIERMHERQYDKLENCFYVDAGAEYKGEETDKLSGLTYLEGEEVAILADGKVLPNRTVKDGKIELTTPASHVIVGLPIIADMKTLPVIMSDRDGGAGRGKMKNICNVFVRVYQSSGILIGPDEESLREYSHREREPYGTPPDVISREVGVLVPPTWSDGGQIIVRQKYPLPLTVCSLAGEVAT
nr:MAG TPA: stabilization protein [Caudoviricetes sp.]